MQTYIIKLSNTAVNHDIKTPPAVSNYVLDRTDFLIATDRLAHDTSSTVRDPFLPHSIALASVTILLLSIINSDVHYNLLALDSIRFKIKLVRFGISACFVVKAAMGWSWFGV